ncbi:hypothetical protein M0802_004155 [Mischocyttarus mexicanus]|nr:hypothetical protein M0802_004155 [Mischocyttarus mexicanus]
MGIFGMLTTSRDDKEEQEEQDDEEEEDWKPKQLPFLLLLFLLFMLRHSLPEKNWIRVVDINSILSFSTETEEKRDG